MTGQAKRASEKEKRSPLPSFLGSEVDGGRGAEKASGRGSSQSSVFAFSHEKEAGWQDGLGEKGEGGESVLFLLLRIRVLGGEGGDGKMGISPPPRPKNIEEEGIAKSIVIAGTLTAEGDSGGGKICRENAHLTVNAVCERKSNLFWSVRLLIFLCLRGRRRGIKFGLFPFPLRLKSLSLFSAESKEKDGGLNERRPSFLCNPFYRGEERGRSFESGKKDPFNPSSSSFNGLSDRRPSSLSAFSHERRASIEFGIAELNLPLLPSQETLFPPSCDLALLGEKRSRGRKMSLARYRARGGRRKSFFKKFPEHFCILQLAFFILSGFPPVSLST